VTAFCVFFENAVADLAFLSALASASHSWAAALSLAFRAKFASATNICFLDFPLLTARCSARCSAALDGDIDWRCNK
jgi:hypothetical protein